MAKQSKGINVSANFLDDLVGDAKEAQEIVNANQNTVILVSDTPQPEKIIEVVTYDSSKNQSHYEQPEKPSVSEQKEKPKENNEKEAEIPRESPKRVYKTKGLDYYMRKTMSKGKVPIFIDPKLFEIFDVVLRLKNAERKDFFNNMSLEFFYKNEDEIRKLIDHYNQISTPKIEIDLFE